MLETWKEPSKNAAQEPTAKTVRTANAVLNASASPAIVLATLLTAAREDANAEMTANAELAAIAAKNEH